MSAEMTWADARLHAGGKRLRIGKRGERDSSKTPRRAIVESNEKLSALFSMERLLKLLHCALSRHEPAAPTRADCDLSLNRRRHDAEIIAI